MYIYLLMRTTDTKGRRERYNRRLEGPYCHLVLVICLMYRTLTCVSWAPIPVYIFFCPFLLANDDSGDRSALAPDSAIHVRGTGRQQQNFSLSLLLPSLFYFIFYILKENRKKRYIFFPLVVSLFRCQFATFLV